MRYGSVRKGKVLGVRFKPFIRMIG